jgi:ribosomal-protein-alanine N-acetyltransferase
MDKVLEGGRERGAVAATLEVRSTNRSAIALYSSFGFGRAGRRRGYYRDGTDALIMWRRSTEERS